MGNFENYLASRGDSKSTIKRCREHVAHLLNWCDDENIEVEFINYNELLNYITYEQKKGLQQSSIQVKISQLRKYYNWLIHEDLITNNPLKHIETRGVKRKQLHHILKKEELHHLYENYSVPEDGLPLRLLTAKRDKVIVGLLVYQGISTAEVINLKTNDLKLREGTIEIKGSRRTNSRTLQLESFQILDLMEYQLSTRTELLQHRNQPTDYLFITPEAGKQSSFKNSIKRMMKKLRSHHSSLDSAQQIRASVITHWLGQYNLRQVQEMAGHRYVRSTEEYLNNRIDDLKDEIEKYHTL